MIEKLLKKELTKMIKENLNTRKVIPKDYIYTTIIILAFIIGAVIWKAFRFSYGFFCVLVIIGLTYGIIKPITDLEADIKSKKVKRLYIRVSMLVISILYLSLFMLTCFKMVTVYPLKSDRLYGLYNFIFIMFIPYLFACYIAKVIKDNEQQKSEGEPKFGRHFVLGVYLVIWLFNLGFMAFNLYRPYSSIDLSKFKTPQEISLTRHFPTTTNGRSVDGIRTIDIKDKSLLEQLHREMTENKTENIRYLDEFNYENFHPKQVPLYTLSLSYNSYIDRKIVSNENEEVGISCITIYDNDEVVIETYVTERMFGDHYDKYRIKLSKELIQKIKMQ